jgi:hypothetical protein
MINLADESAGKDEVYESPEDEHDRILNEALTKTVAPSLDPLVPKGIEFITIFWRGDRMKTAIYHSDLDKLTDSQVKSFARLLCKVITKRGIENVT